MRSIQSGQVIEGIRDLQVAYDIKPHKDVLFNIGRAYASLGNLHNAIDYLRRYQRISPTDKEKVQSIISNLEVRLRLRSLVDEGLANIELGSYVRGIALLQRAYNAKHHPSLLFNIGRAYEEAGDRASATLAYRQYLTTQPKDAAAIRRKLQAWEDQQVLAVNVTAPATTKRNRGLRPTNRNRAEALARKRTRSQAGSDRSRLRRTNHKKRRGPSGSGRVKRIEKESTHRANRRRRQTTLRGVASLSPQKPLRPRNERSSTLSKRHNTPTILKQTSLSRRPQDTKKRPTPSLAITSQASVGAQEDVLSAPSITGAPPENTPQLTPNSLNQVFAVEATSTTAAALAAVNQQTLEQSDGQGTYEATVVSASRRGQALLDSPNAATIISAEEIYLSGIQHIPDILRRVPGVEVMSTSATNSNVAIRGFNQSLARQILVLVDGQSVYNDVYGVTFWPSIPVEIADISRIEVIRGPSSAVFGANAFSGVINIITKNPEDLNGIHAHASIGNGDTFIGVAQFGKQWGAFGVNMSAGYHKTDKYEIGFQLEDDRLATTREERIEDAMERFSVNARAKYVFSGRNPSEIYIGGSLVDAFYETSRVDGFNGIYVSTLSPRIIGGFNSKYFTTRFFYNRTQSLVEDQFYTVGIEPAVSSLVTEALSIEPVVTPDFDWFGKHRMVIGAEYRRKTVDMPGTIAPQQENHFALSFQDEWIFNSTFRLLASGRLDFHPQIGALGSPRLAAIVKPSPGQAIRLSLGTAYRLPNMAETYIDISTPLSNSPATAVKLSGNIDLDAERIASIDIGYRTEMDLGSFEIVGWLSHVANLIDISPLAPITDVTALPPDEQSFDVAESIFVNSPDQHIGIGSEISVLLRPWPGVDTGASYSFQYIYENVSDTRLGSAPAHKASFWTQIRLDSGFNASINLNYVSSQLWIEGVVADSSATLEQAFLLEDNFHLMARLGWKLFGDQLEISISGNNLLDIGNTSHREHPFAQRRQARILGNVSFQY